MIRPRFQLSDRLRSFKYAFAGAKTLIRTQHNARIHAVATVCVIAAGLFLHVDAHEWCWLILAIASVWTAEALNTSIEFLADALHPSYNAKIKHCKDIAATGVLIAAIGAIAIGLIIFVPKVLEHFP